MAEKTIVDKASQTVGVGIAMASDVAGAIKTAFDAAVTTVTEVFKDAPDKKVGKKTGAKKTAKQEPPKKAIKNVSKKTAVKAVSKKTVARKVPSNRAATKAMKKPAKRL